MAQLAAGLNVTIAGVTGAKATRFTLTNGDNTQGAPRISSAHLGSDPNAAEPFELTWAAPSNSANAKTATIEYFGAGGPEPGGQATVSVGGVFSVSGTIVSSTSSVQVGDFVRGSVTVRFL